MTMSVNAATISAPVFSTGTTLPAHSSGRARSVFAAIALAVLGVVATALLPTPAEANGVSPTAAIYGLAEDRNIYTIDPGTGQVTGSTSTASLSLVGNLANAFALDRAKSQMYFMGDSSVSGSNSLFFYDQTSGTLGLLATAAEMNVTAMPRNASFYSNRFWWIGETANTLFSATINYTSGLPSSIILNDPLTIDGATGLLNPNDIAINPNTQTLYGSASITPDGNGEFFSISLASLVGPSVPYTKLYDQPVVDSTQIGVQLAYSGDYSTLYAQNYNTGVWYTADTTVGGTFTATGGVTDVSAETGNPGLKMRDLAGDVQAVPEPGTMALAGTGMLMAGVMIYRDRSRRRRRDGLAKVTG